MWNGKCKLDDVDLQDERYGMMRCYLETKRMATSDQLVLAHAVTI